MTDARVDRLVDILVDPIDKSPLRMAGDALHSAGGRIFPIIQGIPVMLIEGVDQTIRVAEKTLNAARRRNDPRDPWQLETTVLDDQKVAQLKVLLSSAYYRPAIDPVISYLLCKTNGQLYEQLVGKLKHYPIPDIRLPSVNAGLHPMMLDIGCGWGRWSLSAAKKGYDVIGLDPSLGAILAGRRAAKTMGTTMQWVVGDARYLPFKNGIFDRVFSYSVLQHFSKADTAKTLAEVNRVLSSQGTSLIQMPNAFGIRSRFHLLRRWSREARHFEVRYYTPSELLDTFQHAVGPSEISVDGFFGLGIQMADVSLMPLKHKLIIHVSEILRHASQMIPLLRSIADSLYVESKKGAKNESGSR